MPTTYVLLVRCDTPGCAALATSAGPDATRCTLAAVEAGWRCGEGMPTYCPPCAAPRRAAAEAACVAYWEKQQEREGERT
jgi:hypothetical protein